MKSISYKLFSIYFDLGVDAGGGCVHNGNHTKS